MTDKDTFTVIRKTTGTEWVAWREGDGYSFAAESDFLPNLSKGRLPDREFWKMFEEKEQETRKGL